jgi:SAM-dependent methyltransferase
MKDTDDTPHAAPLLYNELVSLWPFVSPPSSYVEEVETFRTRFRAHGVPDGANVLHLGSGGGSIDFHLKKYYRVTGIDLSQAMLSHAREINPDVHYMHGDIRSVRIRHKFDAVLLHDAISYMTTIADLEAAYRTAAFHLEPGGVLVTLPEELRSRLIPDRVDAETSSDERRVVTVIQTNYDPDPGDHSFENIFVFLIREDGDLRVEVDRHINGVFELEEFLDAMRAAGFSPVAEKWELTDWPEGQEEMPLVTAVKVQ